MLLYVIKEISAICFSKDTKVGGIKRGTPLKGRIFDNIKYELR